MYDINHWIPAFAGMTAKVIDTARWSSMLFWLLPLPLLLVLCLLFYSAPIVIPAEAGIQEGKAGMVKELQFLPACRNAAFTCHSRWAGMGCINHWIPAFAGMTTKVIDTAR